VTLPDEQIPVAVAFAMPDKQVILDLRVKKGSTVEQAIRQSGVLAHFADIDIHAHSVGIFGKLVAMGHVLQAGDRVEIYRALINDPKQARRLRARGSHGR
jgi:uncharacterized protein